MLPTRYQLILRYRHMSRHRHRTVAHRRTWTSLILKYVHRTTRTSSTTGSLPSNMSRGQTTWRPARRPDDHQPWPATTHVWCHSMGHRFPFTCPRQVRQSFQAFQVRAHRQDRQERDSCLHQRILPKVFWTSYLSSATLRPPLHIQTCHRFPGVTSATTSIPGLLDICRLETAVLDRWGLGVRLPLWCASLVHMYVRSVTSTLSAFQNRTKTSSQSRTFARNLFMTSALVMRWTCQCGMQFASTSQTRVNCDLHHRTFIQTPSTVAPSLIHHMKNHSTPMKITPTSQTATMKMDIPSPVGGPTATNCFTNKSIWFNTLNVNISTNDVVTTLPVCGTTVSGNGSHSMHDTNFSFTCECTRVKSLTGVM